MGKASTEKAIGGRERYGSAADYAYAAMREGIVSGRFLPQRRMREIELSAWLGVSRTPTRQALSRLELEGLLELRPRLGLVVASHDQQAIEELYEMRGALEGTAAALAAQHASARDISSLNQLLAVEATLPKDPVIRYRHNLVFHQELYRAANNRFLIKSLQALNDAIALLGPTTMGMEGRLKRAHEEHRRIVAAIEARDSAAAEKAARAHVDQALAMRRKMLSDQG
jgi:DNA-binding GntR family transcriptional regulator